MITPSYCQTMARYNAWQNDQLVDGLSDMSEDDLRQDRGAFFGSIFGTLNHILWADHYWMNRYDASVAKPEIGVKQSPELNPDFSSWRTARQAMDRHMHDWSVALSEADLQGDLVWFSGLLGKEMRSPKGFGIMQMFNHQTHHRGQVHAMMTGAGLAANVADLPFMPDAY